MKPVPSDDWGRYLFARGQLDGWSDRLQGQSKAAKRDNLVNEKPLPS